MEFPKRKNVRLKNFDYSSPGAYFVTICTKSRMKILSEITVGTGVLDGPHSKLTFYGMIADKYINQLDAFYEDIFVDKYVIMPNHIHLLMRILDMGNGPSGTPVPTNSVIARWVSTFKRFCNKECGRNIWQYRSNDHIIRGREDYENIRQYIDTNIAKWEKDCFYNG